jgi:predicted site-specific integrase-resolvase
METKLLTTPQAAIQLGVSASHMRNLIRTGKATPNQQIGGTWMFSLEEIERVRNRPISKGGKPKKK